NGFRKFTEGALSNRSLPTIAKEAIETILAKADARVLLGLAAAEVGCERAYLYPETGAEARLASDLVAAVVLPRLLPFLRESYLSAPDRRPASWFNMEAPAEKPFLLRFLCSSSCGLSGDALTPEAPTDEPAILVPTPQPGFTPANPFFQTVPIPPTSTPQLPAFLR
ncbi:MAG: hypothetical protein IIB27_10040, partial [Chloroflexi bacterium]|nr:hypothetical protein [Chloroflexota bacterium]